MIQGFVAQIDAALNGFSRTIFNNLASDLAAGLWMIAALIFVVMMINAVLQIKEIGLTAYIGWYIRIAIIIAMASSWSYFEPIYAGVNGLGDSISAAINGGDSVWSSLDELVLKCFTLAKEAGENTWSGVSLTGVVLWAIGGIIAAFGTGMALIAKGGLALALGLAPVFISTLISSGTGQIFASWAKTVIGLLLITVVLAGMMALISSLFIDILSKTNNAGSMQQTGQFLAVCIISIVMLTQIPSLASGMSGAIVSAASGLAVASGMAGAAKNALSAAGKGAGKAVAAGKTGAAMASAARSGTGIRDSAARAMQARRDIAHRSRNQSGAARQGRAADNYRRAIQAARAKASDNEG